MTEIKDLVQPIVDVLEESLAELGEFKDDDLQTTKDDIQAGLELVLTYASLAEINHEQFMTVTHAQRGRLSLAAQRAATKVTAEKARVWDARFTMMYSLAFRLLGVVL